MMKFIYPFFRLVAGSAAALFLVACSLNIAVELPVPDAKPTTPPQAESVVEENNATIPADPDLILHLPFDGSGDDVSGNDNHGTIIGATFVEDRFGNADQSIMLDGVDDLVRVEHSDSLNLTFEATFSLWWLHQAQGAERFYTLFEKSDPDRDGHSRYGMWLTEDLVEVCIQAASAPFHHCLDSEVALKSGEWVHIAGVIDGSSLRIYIDGELAGEKSYSRDVISRSPFNLFVGTDEYQSTPVFTQGVMDDLRIYKRALSEEEVRVLALE